MNGNGDDDDDDKGDDVRRFEIGVICVRHTDGSSVILISVTKEASDLALSAGFDSTLEIAAIFTQ